MRKRWFCLVAVLAVLGMGLAQAGNVDMATAQAVAMDFLKSRNPSGTFRSAQPHELWCLAQASDALPGQAAYYIVNTDRGYVVVTGDDRARTVLAYSDFPLTDINDLPDGVRFWLDLYKQQIELLQSQPGLEVPSSRLRSSWYHPAQSISPLIHSQWSQGSPFNRTCPLIDGKASYAGCSAVALAQVMNYWKYPAACDSLPAYTTTSLQLEVPALESTTLDWANILDNYPVLGGPSTQQLNAVATLLRYAGQAMSMDYKIQGSDADEYDILKAIRFFGYDQAACFVEKSSIQGEDYYADNIWSSMLWNELKMGRPVIYCAYALEPDSTMSGHAFNVDGYNADDDTYHVNFGYRGTGDGYYALNAFLLAGLEFNIGQLMFLNVMPPRPQPLLWASSQEVDMTCHVGDTITQRIIVAGSDLVAGITATIQDPDSAFSMTVTQDIASVVNIIVTFAPGQSGNHDACITVGSQGAQDVLINVHGSASLPVTDPVMLPADSAWIDTTSFQADWTDVTLQDYVDYYVLEVASSPEFDASDSCYVVITPITDLTQMVDSLTPGATYYYRVKAYYIDGTSSNWSNVESVTLPEPQHGFELGDVNHDGRVNIDDVTALIDAVLIPGYSVCPVCADVFPDGRVDISDIAALIDLVLMGPGNHQDQTD